MIKPVIIWYDYTSLTTEIRFAFILSNLTHFMNHQKTLCLSSLSTCSVIFPDRSPCIHDSSNSPNLRLTQIHLLPIKRTRLSAHSRKSQYPPPCVSLTSFSVTVGTLCGVALYLKFPSHNFTIEILNTTVYLLHSLRELHSMKSRNGLNRLQVSLCGTQT